MLDSGRSVPAFGTLGMFKNIIILAAKGIPVMLFYLVVLLGIVISSAGVAQTNQNTKPSSDHTMLNNKLGEKQALSSGKAKFGETQEQHDHYLKKGVDNQPVINSVIHNGDDD